MSTPKKLIVIDLMPILYRGYFVFLKRPRRTTSGIITSSISLLATTLEQLQRTFNPDYMAIAMESATPTFRHQLYPAYKAQREKKPEEIVASVLQAQELAAAMRIPLLRVDGYEADDILGTLAARGAAEGLDVVIVSPDKDLGQLVGPRVQLFRPGEIAPMDEVAVCKHWSVQSPTQLLDLLALAGDASDNIPGLPGVGPKTAVKLLETYHSVENLLAQADQVEGKVGEKLRANLDLLKLSHQLVTINRSVPLSIVWEQLKVTSPDDALIVSVLKKYELFALAKRLNIALNAEEDLFALASASQQDNAPQEAVLETAPYHTVKDTPHTYTLVQTPEELAALANVLQSVETFALDTETTGLSPLHDRMVGCSFATAPGRAWYVAVPAIAEEARAFLAPLIPILNDSAKVKIGHNLKFDCAVFHHLGIEIEGVLHDTLLAHYLLDAQDRHDMDYLAQAYLHYDPISIKTLIGDGKTKTMAEVPLSDICEYAAEDADVTLRLYQAFLPKIKEQGLQTLLETCEEPLASVLLGMEITGVKIDLGALRTFCQELDRVLLQKEIAIRAIIGPGINIASPKQMGEVLFNTLALDPLVKRSARGQYPTDESTLLKIRTRHPIVDLLLEWRACTKLKNTYTDKLPTHIDPEDGRIHTTFNQAFTDTGRLSSSHPNLQNIPIRTTLGQRIRAAFVARAPGWTLLSADYSQVELRLMAALSGDQQMIDAFARGEDIHAQTAATVYGIPLAEVTPQQRSHCKMVNFGIIYGISPFGLAERLQIPRKEAATLIETYFNHYPAVKQYMETMIETAKTKGYAETFFGRRRALPDLASRNASTRAAAERIAINMPIQGTAADIIKFAMVRIAQEFKQYQLKSQMTLQIHDELLFDVPESELEVVQTIVRTAMESVCTLSVPLKVSMGTGQNWLLAH